MDRLKEENELLQEKLRIEKETGWKSVVKWKSKFDESQSQLKKELMLRDQQLKDIAASLLLLEGQLQIERKRMVSQLADKDAEIAVYKTKLTEQEEYLSKIKEQSEKENRLQSLLTYRKNKPTSRLQPSNETEKKDTRRLSRDSVSSDRKSDRNHKKKRRSHSTDSANQMGRSGVRQSRRDTGRKCHDTSQNSTHPVVISRKSREKVKKEKQYFDEKIITSDDSALSPDLSRESSTTSNSSFDSDSSGIRRSTRKMKSEKKRRDEIVPQSSSSDEKNSEPTKNREPLKLKKRKERPSTLPSRCDPAMLNAWAKNELEQGIMI